MIAPIRELQSLVLSEVCTTPSNGDLFLSRVRNALAGLGHATPESGPADIAALLRQGMLRCQLALGEEVELRVPCVGFWPNATLWRQFKCSTRIAGVGHLLVKPERWEPSWLDPGAPHVVEEAIRETSRRIPRPVSGDPLVAELTGHTSYVSRGQRVAVQAAFLIPPGSTAIINLPTGGGKTLAFQLPALAWAGQGGMTVVVTPTIALAKDQEQRFRELQGRNDSTRLGDWTPLAYHGGLSDDSKRAIHRAIRNGEIPVLFASPEALTGALRGPLFDAARQGRLKIFAIDEAHIVSQWGQQFRPEYQSIAGLRDSLLAVCPSTARFRTLLLSATLTADSCDTLRDLFGQEGCQVVGEVALRPEPGFLLQSVNEESEKQARILEALSFLPRPLILYTTLRDHAAWWYQQLESSGYRRIRLVRGGDLSNVAGDQMLRDWRESEVDIVVATSAFGLGMDQQEVRSVVHACLPETIDRYYQEIGRAGRDGNASVALIVTTSQDVATAQGLAEQRLISVDRGFERWEAMWVRNRADVDQVYILSLNDRPSDIAESGLRNASWNLRTLVLMVRAGLIAFASHQPPVVDRRENEDDIAYEERRRQTLERFFREVAVRIVDPRHLSKNHWDDMVASTRTALRAADEKSLRLVMELRSLGRPLNDIFREIYTLQNPVTRPPRLSGSCPVTRNRGEVSFRSAEPEVAGMERTSAILSADFEQALAPSADEAGRCWVSYETIIGDPRGSRRWRESVLSLMRYAVAAGVVELSVPDGLLSTSEWSQLISRSSHRFIIRTPAESDNRFIPEPPVPRLTLLSEVQARSRELEWAMTADRPRHVLIVPRSTLDSSNPNRRLLDLVRHLRIEDLLSRLQL